MLKAPLKTENMGTCRGCVCFSKFRVAESPKIQHANFSCRNSNSISKFSKSIRSLSSVFKIKIVKFHMEIQIDLAQSQKISFLNFQMPFFKSRVMRRIRRARAVHEANRPAMLTEERNRHYYHHPEGGDGSRPL